MKYLAKTPLLLWFCYPLFTFFPSPLIFLASFLQAQAQEMVWEKELLGGVKDKEEESDLMFLMDRSHLTKSVAGCYGPVRELVDDETIKEYLPDVWVSLIKVA